MDSFFFYRHPAAMLVALVVLAVLGLVLASVLPGSDTTPGELLGR